jgi:hypothetical protein
MSSYPDSKQVELIPQMADSNPPMTSRMRTAHVEREILERPPSACNRQRGGPASSAGGSCGSKAPRGRKP